MSLGGVGHVRGRVRGVVCIPVDVAELVNGVDGEDHLCSVEACHGLREVVLKLAEQRQHIATHVVVHHQILREGRGTHVQLVLRVSDQVLLVLEGIVERGDPVLVAKHQHVPLLSEAGGLQGGAVYSGSSSHARTRTWCRLSISHLLRILRAYTVPVLFSFTTCTHTHTHTISLV